ncbi:hypothetical protein EV356DRAFT_64283 [Viridothelium virens]|uniref:Ribosomal protein/NADH dehydrogenase domain-containing protein n=1 Tax=Viridothelium virens TaxID=1048519 RepID=A0A6A6HEW3_VIRVR|nr:hypothetical protein EV356DRAFT_64283 [Viridothelium virens]
MVSVLQRMRKLRTKLLAVRLGPGALVLPQDVKRIHLSFASKINDGHMGPRKFWRHCLPRLKYHNPAVSMTVDRTIDQSAPATLTLFYAPKPSSGSPTASPAPTNSTTSTSVSPDHDPFERTDSIDMKHRTDTQILQELVKVTKAIEISPTPEDEAMIAELEDQRNRSEKDRQLMASVMRDRKAEEARLMQARGEVERLQTGQ